MPTRRHLTAGALAATALASVRPALAREPATFEWRDFSVDMTAVPDAERGALGAYIRQQIDLVESLAIRPDIKTWFRGVPITVDPALNMAGRFVRGRLTLDDTVSPADNPVLLHELLHAYMAERLPRTGELRRFYQEAKTSGDWPAQSYMLSNISEFFAMTASVALWGRAARPPSTRDALRDTMPDYFDWLAREFGLTV